MEKTARERVLNKFDLASDMKKSKVMTNIYNVKLVDGKLKADFEIDGIPRKKGMDYEYSHKRIPKIFNNFKEFSEYAENFFSQTDDELIKLAGGK